MNSRDELDPDERLRQLDLAVGVILKLLLDDANLSRKLAITIEEFKDSGYCTDADFNFLNQIISTQPPFYKL